jgi:hypothetical protein
MVDEICVEMPADLAESFTGDGFDEVVSFRGLTEDAYAVLTVVPAGLAVAANMATILVSRESVKELIEGIKAWAARRTGQEPGSELVIEISARNGNEETSVRLSSRRDAQGGMPQIDTSALASLVDSMLSGPSGGNGGVLPPAP